MDNPTFHLCIYLAIHRYTAPCGTVALQRLRYCGLIYLCYPDTRYTLQSLLIFEKLRDYSKGDSNTERGRVPQFDIYISVLQTEGRIFVLCIRLLPDGSLYFVSLAAKRDVV
jgi:hypothetical protein